MVWPWRTARSASRRARLAISGDSTSSSVIPGARSTAEVPERWRARKPAAHSPTETRTVPLSAGDAAARRRSSARAARSSRSAASTSDSPAALRRRPSGRRSNSAGPPKEASKPASRRPIVGSLSPSARPAARNEPLRATARKTRTSSQFIGSEIFAVGMIRIRIAGRRFCRLLKSKCGAMILRGSAVWRHPAMEATVITIVDVKAELGKLTMLKGRRPEMTEADWKGTNAFATLTPFRDGNIFSAKFSGNGAWERHPNGDELVQVVEGETKFHIMTDEGKETHT